MLFACSIFSKHTLPLKSILKERPRSLGKKAILVFRKNICHKNKLEAHNILIGLEFCHHAMPCLQPAGAGNHQRPREVTILLNKLLKLQERDRPQVIRVGFTPRNTSIKQQPPQQESNFFFYKVSAKTVSYRRLNCVIPLL